MARAFNPESLPNWALVLVGTVGSTIAVWTLILLQRYTEATERTVEFTRQSLILSQRPRIEVRRIVINADIVDGLLNFANVNQIPEEVTGTFEIVNTGSTTARVVAMECRVFLWEQIPAAISRTPLDFIRIEPIKLLPGVYGTRTFRGSIAALDIYIAHGENRSLCVYIVGLVGYEDELGNYRSTSFCRRMDQAFGRLVKTNDPDYEHAD